MLDMGVLAVDPGIEYENPFLAPLAWAFLCGAIVFAVFAAFKEIP